MVFCKVYCSDKNQKPAQVQGGGGDWTQPDLRIIRLVLQWLQGLNPEDKGLFQQISPPFQMADSWRCGLARSWPALPRFSPIPTLLLHDI